MYLLFGHKHYSNLNKIRWSILSARIECVLCSTTKVANFCMKHNRFLSANFTSQQKVGRFYQYVMFTL